VSWVNCNLSFWLSFLGTQTLILRCSIILMYGIHGAHCRVQFHWTVAEECGLPCRFNLTQIKSQFSYSGDWQVLCVSVFDVGYFMMLFQLMLNLMCYCLVRDSCGESSCLCLYSQ
jgi:hypothetical protein